MNTYEKIMDTITDAEPFNAYGEWVWNIDDCYTPEPDGNGLYHCDAAWSKHGEKPWVYSDGFGKTHEDAMIAATARVRDEMERQLHFECRRIEHSKQADKGESLSDRIVRKVKARQAAAHTNALTIPKNRATASNKPLTPDQKMTLASIESINRVAD